MTSLVLAMVEAELRAPAPPHAVAFARQLISGFESPVAVLFYGSVLRTGDLDGVMDFYVLTSQARRGWRGVVGRKLWPDVSYHEIEHEGRTLRAKVASMTLAQFALAARGREIDTTIWTRFVQPSALVWSSSAEIEPVVINAVAEAAHSAARFAAALGPVEGPAEAYWAALFQQTYKAEFRVERGGREQSILAFDAARYDRLLIACWREQGLLDILTPGSVQPNLTEEARARFGRAWQVRRRMGKSLNVARLIKAAFTFEGAARYAAWKIERHTGVAVPLTPWREKHPVLAAPGVLWDLWRAQKARKAEA